MTASTIRLVVIIVGAIALIAVTGIVALAFAGKATPDVLQNIAIGGLTGLLGLLVQPTKEDPPAV